MSRTDQQENYIKNTPLFKRNFFYIGILIALVLLAYTNSLNNGFVSDDISEIVENPNVGNISVLTTHPFGFIRLFFYWIAFNLGGLNPIAFRLINIFFHAGSVICVYFLVKKVWNNKNIAFFSASLLAVHPLLTEPVIWISGGSYQQYTFFFLSSILFYIYSRREKLEKSLYMYSILFLLMSFMSHPVMPGALFVMFIVYEIVFGDLKRNWAKIIPYFILTLVYVFINIAAIPERETTLQTMHYQEKGTDNLLLTVPIAFGSYFNLFVWPQDLTLYHSELNFSSVELILMYLVTIIFFSSLIISYKKNKIIFFWLSLSLVAIAPTLTPFRLNWIVAERYIYLPSIGIFAITGYFLEKAANYKKLKPVVYSIFILIISLLIIRTIIRNTDWKTDISLWFATGKTSPSSPNNHNNLGDAYGRLGDKQKALQEFQTAIILKPNYGDAYHNLANTYHELHNGEKALENYKNAVKYNPNLWQSYQNIAALYFEAKQYDLSLENIEQAIKINPKNINLRVSQGVVYLNLKNKQKAQEIFNLVLSANPESVTAKQGLIEANKL